MHYLTPFGRALLQLNDLRPIDQFAVDVEDHYLGGKIVSPFRLLLVALAVVLLPSAALAQSTITGEVSDNTGGILPGVTVEVASPVLIEGSRNAVTDGTGRYTIANIRPGIYTVTMTLPGFSTFIQEAIEVPANFTQTVNGQLAVGGLEETVTVSGQSPLVDVQSAARTEVLARDTIDALPTPRNTQSIGYLAQGVRLMIPDVGGSQMMEQVRMTSNGANGSHTTMQVDGMMVNSMLGDGGIMNYNNQALSQEMAVSTSGSPAEVQAGGLRLNMIPKDGGNTFSGSFYGGMTDGSWQANNFTDELANLGLVSGQGISNIHDINPAAGGPILQDKLWFFGSFRNISVDQFASGAFIPTFRGGATEAEIEDYFRTFDQDHAAIESKERAILNQYVRSGLLRLTSQISPRNKVSAYLDRIFKAKDREFTNNEGAGANIEPIRAAGHRDPGRANYHTFQAKWTSTISNRSLLEVGYSQVYERLLIGYQPSDPIDQGGAGIQLEFPAPADLRTCIMTPCYHDAGYDQTSGWYQHSEILDLGNNLRTGSYGQNLLVTPSDRRYPNVAFSYVTGSHNFKAGMQWSFGDNGGTRDRSGSVRIRPREGVPEAVDVYNTPTTFNVRVKADRGIYFQDAWTVDRFTVNAGVRFEQFQSRTNTFRTGDLPQGRFVPARTAVPFDQKPFWNDVAPRFSVVYDLFGDARTAVKFSANKFVRPWTSGFAGRYSPFGQQTDRRDWLDCALAPDIHDGGLPRCATAADLVGLPADPAFYLSSNGDFIPQDHEIGLNGNTAVFSSGALPASGRRPDPNLQREINWEYSASIQHELFPRVSATFAYYHRRFSDLEQQNNAAIQPCLDPAGATAGVPCGSWIPFSVTFDDPEGRVALLQAQGQDIDLAPTTFLVFNRDPATTGLTDNVDITSDVNRSFYDGFEMSMNARLPNGGTLFGGWTVHKNIQNTCGLFNNPNGVSQEDLVRDSESNLRGGPFCDQSALGIPFRHDFKLFGTYPLPWGFEFSGSIQSYSGNEREARWTIPASYYPGEQRTVASEVQLFVPGTNFYDRWNQVDIAFRKLFRFDGYQMSGQMDIYNLMNSSVVVDDSDIYGSAFGRPTRILEGRMLRLALQTSW